MEDVAFGDPDLMEELFMAASVFDFSDFSQPGAGGASPGIDFFDFSQPGASGASLDPCFSPLFDICTTTTTATPLPAPSGDDNRDHQHRAATSPRRGWVFQPRPEVETTVKERLRRALERIASLSQTHPGELLAQVWVPIVIGDRQVLTTCGQPFWLDRRNERLASYRTVSMKYQFSVDETARTDLGMHGRVFVGRVPEWTPDVRYLSSEEYPPVRHAQYFDIRGSVALPIIEPRSRACLGVVELVMTTEKVNYNAEIQNICSALKEVDLRSSDASSDPRAKGQPPKALMKKSTTKTTSLLAIEGAPALTTPEASNDGGLWLLKPMGFTMNTTQGSGSSSQQDSQSLPPQTEFVNDSEPIQVDDDEPEDNDFGTKRKLNSVVWKEFKKVKICGNVKAQCLYCHKQLGGKSTNGTSHLHGHLKICSQRKIKLSDQKRTLEQSALRFNSKGGKIFVENYTFDPEVARKELAAMIVPHEYPLSIVHHAGSESTPSLEPEDSQAAYNARFAETVTARMKATGKRPSPAASSQEQNVGAVLAKEVEGSEKGSEINHSPDDSPSKKQCLDVSDGMMDLEAALCQAVDAKSSIENIIKIYKDGIGDDFTKLFRQSEPKRVNRFKDRSSIMVPKSQDPWIHMVLGYMRHDFEEIKGLIAVPVLDKSALVTAITRSLERWGMLLQDRAIPQEASELIDELKDLQINLSADSKRAVPINVSTLRSDEKHIQDQLKIGNNSHKSAQLCLSTLEEYGAAWDKILQYVKNKKLQHLSKIKELESALRLARSELSKEQGHEATIVNSQAQYNKIKSEASEAVSHLAELLACGKTCLESIQASIQEAGSQGHSNLSAELCLQLKFIESCQVERAD